MSPQSCVEFFFFNDTATTEIYTLSLHDALPISLNGASFPVQVPVREKPFVEVVPLSDWLHLQRSEEHTSELQSHLNLVCRLLLEKKNIKPATHAQRSWLVAHNQLAVSCRQPRTE